MEVLALHARGERCRRPPVTPAVTASQSEPISTVTEPPGSRMVSRQPDIAGDGCGGVVKYVFGSCVVESSVGVFVP